MDKYKASFRFYDKAAPYPGFCLRCGTTEKLWHLGEIRGTTMAAYYCDSCLTETAAFTGMVHKHVYEQETTELRDKVRELEAQVAVAPELLKELSTNVNNILSDFVVTLAGLASDSVSNGDKGSKADAGSTEAKSGSTAQAGQGKSKGAKPSTELAG